MPKARHLPRLRWLLLGVSGFALATPLIAFATHRIYDTYLLRQTERQLIAQAVVIGESFRTALHRARGQSFPDQTVSIKPVAKEHQRYVPTEPVIDLNTPVWPPQPQVNQRANSIDPAYQRAGATVEPQLLRAQVFNLSAVRILDPNGCVVATTRGERGFCLGDLPEVRAALNGTYQAKARRRVTDEPLPRVGAVRRRGDIRIFAALPIFEAGRVIGVVRVSRTSLDALTSLWLNRRGLITVAAITTVLILSTSLISAQAISKPLRNLTHRAKAIAKGHRSPGKALGWAPREVHELSEALQTMTQHLQERAEYISEFASNVSHELKTPITGIAGATELLLEKSNVMSDAQRMRFLLDIQGNAQRMDRLVGGLLELARLENANPRDEESVLVAKTLQELTERSGAELVICDAPIAPPETLRIQPETFVSAIGNLIENALRHGEGRPVTVKASSDEGRLKVQVSDRGSGISEANQPRVFERFFTTERDRGGTGLGLAMVKAVAERRGGAVHFVTSEQGTSFTLIL